MTGPISTGPAASRMSAGSSGTIRYQPTTTAADITAATSSQKRVRSRREAKPSGRVSRASISSALPVERVAIWIGPPVTAAGESGDAAARAIWLTSPIR